MSAAERSRRPWRYVGQMRDNTAKVLSRIHTALYRLTSGVIGRRLVDNDMLLLTTTGRHTGDPHTVPLLYLGDGDRYVVFASWGGRDRHPEWYLNLQAAPHGVAQVRGNSHHVVATTARGDERDRWWMRARSAYTGYAAYQDRTDRTIPVVFLDPPQATAGVDGAADADSSSPAPDAPSV